MGAFAVQEVGWTAVRRDFQTIESVVVLNNSKAIGDNPCDRNLERRCVTGRQRLWFIVRAHSRIERIIPSKE